MLYQLSYTPAAGTGQIAPRSAVRKARTAALAIPSPPRYLTLLSTSANARLTGPPVPGGCPFEGRDGKVAKVNPGEFFRQVKLETAKVVWPTRKETMMTALMVVIMASILGLFFFGVDSIFNALVRGLLSLIA